MGNRGGVIHNEAREIVRPYASRRWITCLLQFKNRHRVVMSPRRYTELFFLDEAVTLAAGHRPCAECRRERFNAFKEAWKRAYGFNATADEIDAELHPERIGSRREKITHEAEASSLPDGCFVRIDASSYLLRSNRLLLWTPEGYSETRHCSGDSTVTVLTPEPLVRCMRQGFTPALHESAN